LAEALGLPRLPLDASQAVHGRPSGPRDGMSTTLEAAYDDSQGGALPSRRKISTLDLVAVVAVVVAFGAAMAVFLLER